MLLVLSCRHEGISEAGRGALSGLNVGSCERLAVEGWNPTNSTATDMYYCAVLPRPTNSFQR